MGSCDENHTKPHHKPRLRSLVVRPSVSDGTDDGGRSAGVGGTSDYKPGEVPHEPPSYYRSYRHPDEPGHRARAGPASPMRHKDEDDHHGSDFDHSGDISRSRQFGSRRDTGAFRNFSPPHARGSAGGRSPGTALDRPAFSPGPAGGDRVRRNNPIVRLRKGDWICPDALCEYLNFASREYCRICKQHCLGLAASPRRGYPGPLPSPPPLPFPTMRYHGPSIDIFPGRTANDNRFSSRGWARDGPRDFGPGDLPPRHEGWFSDDTRKDRLEYPEDDYRGRNKAMPPMDWGHRDRGRDNLFNDSKVYGMRSPSPPAHSLPHGLNF